MKPIANDHPHRPTLPHHASNALPGSPRHPRHSKPAGR